MNIPPSSSRVDAQRPPALRDAAAAFLKLHRRYADYRQEFVAIAPVIGETDRRAIDRAGALAQPLNELVRDL